MDLIKHIQLATKLPGLMLGNQDKPVGMSIDITKNCNLRCKYCYFFQQGYDNELKDEDFLKVLKNWKERYPSILQATWIGGEPLLRKNLVEKGMKLFLCNVVVTNGTLELPSWRNCTFNVSVDGTKDYYEELRGKGNYDRMKKNVNRTDVRVNLACVLTKMNQDAVAPMLKEWSKTNICGITFDFYTPIEGIKDDLWLNFEERNEVIDKLISLKKTYGNFILNSHGVLNLMKKENSSAVTGNCMLPKSIISIGPDGKRKLPCVLGEKADCEKCGCIIPYQMHSMFKRKQLGSMYSGYKVYT